MVDSIKYPCDRCRERGKCGLEEIIKKDIDGHGSYGGRTSVDEDFVAKLLTELEGLGMEFVRNNLDDPYAIDLVSTDKLVYIEVEGTLQFYCKKSIGVCGKLMVNWPAGSPIPERWVRKNGGKGPTVPRRKTKIKEFNDPNIISFFIKINDAERGGSNSTTGFITEGKTIVKRGEEKKIDQYGNPMTSAKDMDDHFVVLEDDDIVSGFNNFASFIKQKISQE